MARLRIEVVQALPDRLERVVLELEAGATVRSALAAAGFPPRQAVGIFGRRAAPEDRLADGDRVEVYRPLRADPKEARRRRALKPGR
jgi:putative ubiquitin-RnfH superfamily antitoxin RatB of RatAB toxin-antitoxin module